MIPPTSNDHLDVFTYLSATAMPRVPQADVIVDKMETSGPTRLPNQMLIAVSGQTG